MLSSPLHDLYALLFIQLPPGESKTSTLYRLKFLILKNLAAIAKEKGDVAASISAYTEVCQVVFKGVFVFLFFLFSLTLCHQFLVCSGLFYLEGCSVGQEGPYSLVSASSGSILTGGPAIGQDSSGAGKEPFASCSLAGSLYMCVCQSV